MALARRFFRYSYYFPNVTHLGWIFAETVFEQTNNKYVFTMNTLKHANIVSWCTI